MQTLRPSQLADLLDAALAAQLPILVTGPPGCGKSDIVAQACNRNGADLIISHPAVADPTDAKGLPWAEAGADEATFLPFGELAQALQATKLTVWFLDDLGQASPAVQASFMQLLLARRVNSHKLPDCVTFVAATNRRSDRAGVAGILEPVKARFASIVELEPDNNEFCLWGLDNGLSVLVVAFVRFRPELLCDFQPSADLTNCPMPRTWAHVSKLLELGLDPELEFVAIAGAVGEGAAAEFIAFAKMYRELPNIDGIFVDPDADPLPDQPSTLYATVTALGARMTTENFARVARYAERLMEEGRGEFAALLVRDCIRKDREVMSTAAFVRLASGEFSSIITGIS